MNTEINNELQVLHQAIESINKLTNQNIVSALNTSFKSDNVRARADASIMINAALFLCEIKTNVTRANINTVIDQIRGYRDSYNHPFILVAKYILPAMMTELMQNEINYLDVAGNCCIKHGNTYLFIQGQKNNWVKIHSGRAFKAVGLKIIFHFLRFPDSVNLSYRDLQQKTGVSIGSIKLIVDELIESQYILKTKSGRFLKNRQMLLNKWVVSYNEILKPKLLISQFTFRDNELRNKWLTLDLPEGMYWGGESGAHLLDGYLYPQNFDIYSDVSANKLLNAGVVMPDKNGEIKIYRRFWTDDDDNQNSKLVPILLIYADLMGSGNSRNIETANRIYEHNFANFE